MNNSFIIKSKRFYTEEGIKSGAMLIKDGLITGFFNDESEIPDEILNDGGIQITDAKDHCVIPGIIDLHSHGYKTWSAKTTDKEEIKGLSKALPSIGVTAGLATTTAWSEEEFSMLKAIADAIDEGTEGAEILGIHMEGPFYNPDRHNATLRSEVIPPTVEKTKAYIEAARGHLKYMTIAPEVDGALEVIRYLSSHGIVAGAGHTDATAEEMKKGIKAGIKVSIHTGNAMRQIDRRDVGALGAALLSKDIYCEIICDLFHLSKEMLEIMFRVKNDFSKFLMISDSDNLSGAEPGRYFAFNKYVNIYKDGRILLDDGTISGSSKYVLYGISNLVKKLGLPLETVLPMFSLNPAALMGISERKGSLSLGKEADIVIINDDFEVQRTFVRGKCAYKKGDAVEGNKNFEKICRRIS